MKTYQQLIQEAFNEVFLKEAFLNTLAKLDIKSAKLNISHLGAPLGNLAAPSDEKDQTTFEYL